MDEEDEDDGGDVIPDFTLEQSEKMEHCVISVIINLGGNMLENLPFDSTKLRETSILQVYSDIFKWII